MRCAGCCIGTPTQPVLDVAVLVVAAVLGIAAGVDAAAPTGPLGLTGRRSRFSAIRCVGVERCSGHDVAR